jgi:hypothetical protein
MFTSNDTINCSNKNDITKIITFDDFEKHHELKIIIYNPQKVKILYTKNCNIIGFRSNNTVVHHEK